MFTVFIPSYTGLGAVVSQLCTDRQTHARTQTPLKQHLHCRYGWRTDRNLTVSTAIFGPFIVCARNAYCVYFVLPIFSSVCSIGAALHSDVRRQFLRWIPGRSPRRTDASRDRVGSGRASSPSAADNWAPRRAGQVDRSPARGARRGNGTRLHDVMGDRKNAASNFLSYIYIFIHQTGSTK